MAKRHSKEIINKSDLDMIINISAEKAAEKSTIMELFGDFGKGPKFNPYDTLTIPAGKYGKTKKNKNAFKTTVGLWIFNKSFIEDMSDVLGYINETVDGGVYEDINQKLSYALLEKKITIDQLKHFVMQTQIVMGCASAICPSHTMDMLLLTNKAEVKKKQLEKEYGDRIEKGDLTAMKAVEDNLIDFAKEQLKDSESVDMYNSRARASWGNNFKNMYLVKGPIKHTDSTYSYASGSYISGMHKEDFSAINDAAVGGPYSRSNKTREGGYLEKQFTNATQHIKILPEGSDCGSDRCIKVTLTKKNISMWMYCFYKNGSSYTEITTDNKDKLIGKTVMMRYSGFCKSKNGCICEKCAGTMYRRIGIENVGLGVMIMASSMKLRAMKSFHDNTLSLSKIDPNNIF